MARQLRRFGAVALALLGLIGCEAGVKRDGAEQLMIQNGNPISYCTLQIKRANSQTQWGSNVLARGESIEPDGSYVIDRLKPGYYDLRVLPCNELDGAGNYKYDVQVVEGAGATWLIGPESD